jgi:hypothetical protein
MKLLISVSAAKFTTSGIADWVGKLPNKYGVTGVKTTKNTVSFKMGSKPIYLTVTEKNVQMRENRSKGAIYSNTLRQLKTLLSKFTLDKQAVNKSKAKRLKDAADEFIQLAKKAGFKSPVFKDRYIALGVKKSESWFIEAATKGGFVLYYEPLNPNKDGKMFGFESSAELKKLFDGLFKRPNLKSIRTTGTDPYNKFMKDNKS